MSFLAVLDNMIEVLERDADSPPERMTELKLIRQFASTQEKDLVIMRQAVSNLDKLSKLCLSLHERQKESEARIKREMKGWDNLSTKVQNINERLARLEVCGSPQPTHGDS